MNVDVLSDVLQSMRINGSVYFCDFLKAPWTKDFSAINEGSFHQVRRGGCWVVSRNLCDYLGPGDLVFLKEGQSHILTSQKPDTEPVNSDAQTLLLCCYYKFEDVAETPLRGVFPSVRIVRDEEIQNHPWLKGTLDQLSNEYQSQNPGAELIINKLTEVVLVELIRMDFGRDNQSRFLVALSDNQISKALQLLHTKPEGRWTLEKMAELVGMSRAVFARKFKELVGQPMFEYLTRLRLTRAKESLTNTRSSVAQVAHNVGYESELSFTKVFKKNVGLTPTRYRTMHTRS